MDVGGSEYRDLEARSGQNVAKDVMEKKKASSIKSALPFIPKVLSQSKKKKKIN